MRLLFSLEAFWIHNMNEIVLAILHSRSCGARRQDLTYPSQSQVRGVSDVCCCRLLFVSRVFAFLFFVFYRPRRVTGACSVLRDLDGLHCSFIQSCKPLSLSTTEYNAELIGPIRRPFHEWVTLWEISCSIKCCSLPNPCAIAASFSSWIILLIRGPRLSCLTRCGTIIWYLNSRLYETVKGNTGGHWQ